MKLTEYSAPQSCESCRPVARAQTRTTKDSSALKLTLKTAEGDTVEISLEAQSLRQSERSSARGPGGRISQKSNTQSDSFTASVNVKGDLSDAELEDIQGLLQSLASGDTPQAGADELDTISAYQYSYQHTREVSRSQVEIFG
jgi:hypothetical protein